jgi:hypothetical protein
MTRCCASLRRRHQRHRHRCREDGRDDQEDGQDGLYFRADGRGDDPLARCLRRAPRHLPQPVRRNRAGVPVGGRAGAALLLRYRCRRYKNRRRHRQRRAAN